MDSEGNDDDDTLVHRRPEVVGHIPQGPEKGPGVDAEHSADEHGSSEDGVADVVEAEGSGS